MDSFVCFCLLISNFVQEHEILILFFIVVFF